MVYGILAEDESDADMLMVIVRRILGINVKVLKHGFGGCGDLLKEGAKKLRSMHREGGTKFLICHDADGNDVEERVKVIKSKIIDKAEVDATFCALIPRQEIESWILADIDAVSKVILNFRPPQYFSHPENIDSPKERLERMCKVNCRPRYSHATHNAKVASYLDLGMVAAKCPSFAPLKLLVEQNTGNC